MTKQKLLEMKSEEQEKTCKKCVPVETKTKI